MDDMEYESAAGIRVKKNFPPYLLPPSSLSVLILEQAAKGGKVLDGDPCPRVSRGG